MKNKKRKSLFALIALVILSGVSAVSGTYAYWNTLQEVKGVTQTIGEGIHQTVQVNASAQAGKTLVPAGHAVPSDNQVEEVVFTYFVNLNRTVAAPLTFNVVKSNVLIGEDATHAGLVIISIDAPATLVDTTLKTVTVKVTLTEPADQTAYNAIINQNITFNLTFTVSQL